MTTSQTSSGKIVTFYSYKGGTGRSMALANIACLLAQRQKKSRILMIDWDLEAPGLHRFFQSKISNRSKKNLAIGKQPGLIDLFLDIQQHCKKTGSETDEITDGFFENLKFDNYVAKTNLNSLFLMTAGRLDNHYSTLVSNFDWEGFFNLYPSLIPKFAEYLAKKYDFILVDSRTGYTDISGICTAIMPDKLVVVFTPNNQSISGVIGVSRFAIEYRKQSDDLRQLVIFPLVSRIEPAEPKLQKSWRYGEPGKEIIGYQKEFESLFTDIYNLSQCDLTSYFDDVQIQHVPRYAYGEEIAVLAERTEERLSLAKSYERFTNQLLEKDRPWDATIQTQKRSLTAKVINDNKPLEIIIDIFLSSNLNYLTAGDIANTISALEKFQSAPSNEDNADVLLGYISQITSHLYVAEGYATDDVPRNIEYYRNMEAARRLFRQVRNLR